MLFWIMFVIGILLIVLAVHVGVQSAKWAAHTNDPQERRFFRARETVYDGLAVLVFIALLFFCK